MEGGNQGVAGPKKARSARGEEGIVVNPYSEGWLKRGFPWVYSEEVVGRTRSVVPGRVVTIRSRGGECLGVGIWDAGKVEVRRFRTNEGPLDEALFRERLRSAYRRRSLPKATSAWRWVHGENDDLPGIRVDVWGEHVGVVLDSPSLQWLVGPLVDAIRAEREVRSIWLSWRLPDEEDEVAYETSDLPQGLIWGERPAEDVVVTERGLKVGVRPWEGPDVGLYCDMRDLRAWLEPHWHHRRVLNTFAYTGMFSLAAASGGAKHVTSVDLSEKYLDRARANFRLNGVDDSRHDFEAKDTFKALDAWRRKGERFDIVIVDPPSFSHSPEGTWSSRKDLPRMIAAALRVTEPGGWLIVCSNQGKVSPKDFQKQIQAGAQKAERSLRLIHQGSQPLDFPAALDFPESRYLKCWVLQG